MTARTLRPLLLAAVALAAGGCITTRPPASAPPAHVGAQPSYVPVDVKTRGDWWWADGWGYVYSPVDGVYPYDTPPPAGAATTNEAGRRRRDMLAERPERRSRALAETPEKPHRF